MSARKRPARASVRPASRRPPAAKGGGKKKNTPESAKRKQAKKPPRRAARNVSTRFRLTTSVSVLAGQLRPRPATEFRVHVRRPDDLLVFDLVFENLKLEPGGSPRLVREVASKPAYFVMELPPQSFGEEAFADKTGPEDASVDLSIHPPMPETAQGPGIPQKNNQSTAEAQELRAMPAAKVRMSGKSRLAFTMPDTVAELGFDLSSVLAAAESWPLRLDAIAAPEPPRVFLPGQQVGKQWLSGVTTSASWTSTAAILLDALQRDTSPEIAGLVTAAGAKVGEQAATALAAGRTDGLDATLERALLAEVDTLAQRFPALRTAPGRDAAIAAVSLKATESLAASRSRFGDDLSFSPLVPFIPVFLSPHEPSDAVTAIELPYRLQISPIESAHFQHSASPVTNAKSGMTELWHTRLTTAASKTGPTQESKFRAIWSPDYPIDDLLELLDPPEPYRMSLDPLDRQMLVKLMAGYDEQMSLTPPSHGFLPRPSIAHRLMLSALGGLLDSEGAWTTRPETIMRQQPLVTARIGLEQWRHLATLGRDHYVRVVYAGYLMPFGHRASLIKVTERKFEPSNPAQRTENRVAVLRQRYFIIVREHLKAFPGAGTSEGWFDFPFPQVEIITKETPSLRVPDKCKVVELLPGSPIYDAAPPRAAFWPMLTDNVNTGNFLFDIVATDLCGTRVTFAMPLLFVGDEANTGMIIPPGMISAQPVAAHVVAAYNAVPESPRRTGPTGGISVCYAPLDPDDPDKCDTRMPTSTLAFRAAAAAGSANDPHFTPHLVGGFCGIPQLQRLLGLQPEFVRVEYPTVYRNGGFAANPGEVFLKLPDPHDLAFGGSKAKSDSLGALVSPAMSIHGMSRLIGPVAATPDPGGDEDKALTKTIGNSFDPVDFFKEEAKILGGVDLRKVLQVVALAADDVPRLVTKDLPGKVEASFHWATEIKQSDPANLLVPGAGGPTMLAMDGMMSAPVDDSAAATFDATASLTNFKVNLFGFIIIWFDALHFKASRGKKTDVSVRMHEGDQAVTFGGPLEFVNDLREFIPSNGFSDSPNLQVTPSGISAHYSLSLPSIEVGIFALSNVSLGAGFSLPFDAQPVFVKFNFCERHSPFNLTVAFLGGGGFFAIGIGTEGVREIEAALEFGAGIAIDLGVASGAVEIKAGVYYHWLEAAAGKTVELTGYVRLHGELTVLGLISASLTFNLQLTYLKKAKKSSVWGEATLIVEIEILFFSISVSVKCRREFGGSASDPTVAALLPEAPLWAEYCAAFAAD
jgi:hypothetical protein